MKSVKSRYLAIMLFFVLIGWGIFSYAKETGLLADYNIVPDLAITLEKQEGAHIQLKISDQLTDNTTLFMPIVEQTQFITESESDGFVILDEQENRLIIDWIEPKDEKKSVFVELELEKPGDYTFQIQSVYDGQLVTSEPLIVTLLEEEDTREKDASTLDTNRETVTDQIAEVVITPDILQIVPDNIEEEKVDLNATDSITPTQRKATKESDFLVIKDTFPDLVLRQSIASKLPIMNGAYYVTKEALASVKNLYLDANQSQMDFTGISYLTSLETLSVNRLAGGIDFAPIRELKSLTNLTLFMCDNEWLAELPYFKNLTTLEISLTPVSNDDLNYVSQLPKLTSLGISTTEISNLFPIANLKGLKKLDIQGNKITDEGLESLSFFTNLVSLNIGNLNISDLSPLKTLVNLQSISGGYTNIENISALQYMPELTKIWFFDTKVKDISALKNLTKLKNVSIASFGGIEDFSPFYSLNQLETLQIRYNQLVDPSFLKNLPALDTSAPYKLQIDTQQITLKDVATNLGGKVRVKNPVVDENQQPIVPNQIMNNGVYKDGYVEWENLPAETTALKYTFSQNILIKGQPFLFSGVVNINVEPDLGELSLKSAPENLSFGDVLELSAQKKTYSLEKLETPVTVEDTRSEKNTWALSAQMIETLKSDKSNSVLPEALQYKLKGVKQTINMSSIPIYSHKNTTDDFNVSDLWTDDQNGLFLEIKPGEALAEIYRGKLRWALQDTPSNE